MTEQTNESVELVVMEDPEEIIRYWRKCKQIPWSEEHGARKAVGRVLCGDYGVIKAILDGEVKALVIFQNQLGQNDLGQNVVNCFVVQIVPVDNIGLVRKFRKAFFDLLRSWNIYKVQSTSREKKRAIERLFGLEYQYSVFERKL